MSIQNDFDAYMQIRDNAMALADPQAMIDAALENWMRAVTNVLASYVAAPVADAAPSSTEPATIAPTTPGV